MNTTAYSNIFKSVTKYESYLDDYEYDKVVIFCCTNVFCRNYA